jgi:hypothetical protein
MSDDLVEQWWLRRWGRSPRAIGAPAAGQDHITLPGSARSTAVYHSRSGFDHFTCTANQRRCRIMSVALRARNT